jgi:hypothetical protein
MPGSPEFAEISYVLTDCIVAAYNKFANTYSTPAALANGQKVVIEAEADNDKLRGYGAYTAGLSVITGAKVVMGYGGVDVSIMTIIAGVSDSSSGSTPNRVRRNLWAAGGAGLPYFGLIGTAATDDGGLLVVGCQAVKLNTFPTYTLDGSENKFNINETDGYAFPVAISGTSYVMVARLIETASTWVAPTTGGAFLSFFTS